MNSPTSEMPQDSTLRRHWQSAQDMQASSSSPATTKDTTQSASNASSGGIFSWMKSLFS